MKTPNEIKIALQLCKRNSCKSECPYHGEKCCYVQLHKDAVEYIERMEGKCMSYDISFRVKVDGIDAWVDVGDCNANITWNVRKIIVLSTGLPWINEASNGLVKDVIPCIEKGRLELMSNPKKYKRYEAKNGWGTVDGTIAFFDRILRCWDDFVRNYEELVDVVAFWIT